MDPSRGDFCHPYQPYDIQLQFMQDLYQCIEHGNVGIFESPTGTGKSLSLICGALTWLRDHSRRDFEQSTNAIDTSDWLAVSEANNRWRELLRDREDLEKRLALLRQEENAEQKGRTGSRSSKRLKIGPASLTQQQNADSEFALEEYDDVGDVPQSKDNLSSKTQALLDQLKPPVSEHNGEEDTDRIKIIFCSRTHSQLTQFIHELNRVSPPSGLPSTAVDGTVSPFADTVKHITLGSRKNLCINPKVSQLGSTMAINERCLDLQKANAPKDGKCPYLPSKENKSVSESFRNRAIAKIRDIEDIAGLGREMGICPYYASREALTACEVLTLPYPLLLQQAAREALGVNVKGNVVVIDEAHNLMDAIADTMSMSLSLASLNLATTQTTSYVQRFKQQLKGANRMYITQVLRLMNSLTDFLHSSLKDGKKAQCTTTAAQLMSGKGIDQIQPHKLLEYLSKSKLAYKVEGYAEAHTSGDIAHQPRGALLHVQSFLAILMNPDAEGSFFVVRQDQDITVKYTLLDPRQHFRSIVENARAVILAGGTMSPMSDYQNYLFSYLDPSRLKTFSFGHVIPKANLLAESISKGPNGIEFDFTYSNRTSEEMIVELGKLFQHICRIVPDGVVAFFPSYDYLATVTAVWKRMPSPHCIFESLSSCKQIFEETRGSSVESLLKDFAEAIDCGKAGLMLSVIGGKLSEGINFSDKLGRAVLAIGLPFPNIQSAELKAKIEYIEKARHSQHKAEGLSDEQCKLAAKAAGRDFYENICMRAVNQSIGRAIRHRNDYAAIMMIDRRFSSETIRTKLPKWILASMNNEPNRGDWRTLAGGLQDFFRVKQNS